MKLFCDKQILYRSFVSEAGHGHFLSPQHTRAIVRGECLNSHHLGLSEFFALLKRGWLLRTATNEFTGIVSAGVKWFEHDILEHVGEYYVIVWHFNGWALRRWYMDKKKAGKLLPIDQTTVKAGWMKVVSNVFLETEEGHEKCQLCSKDITDLKPEVRRFGLCIDCKVK